MTSPMKRIRDAQTIIGTLEGGETMAALSREITDTLSAMMDAGGDRPKGKVRGSVMLKLDIVVESGTATIRADVSSKRPKEERGSSFFWVLEDGSLTTDHPKQSGLFDGPKAIDTNAN